MICKFCGNEIPDGSRICPKCNTILNQAAPAPAMPTPPQSAEVTPEAKPEKKKSFLPVLIAGVICVIIAIIAIVEFAVIKPKADLKEILVTEWEDSKYDIEFYDDKVEYRLDFGTNNDTVVFNYNYKIISKNKVKVYTDDGEVVWNIKFTTNNKITISPFIDGEDRDFIRSHAKIN